jgi:hypothetical protein
MKTSSLFTFLQKMMVLVVLIYLSSCQKEISQNTLDNNGTITKVNSWLESQKNSKYVIGASADNIKTNLDFAKLYYEKLSETEKLIIIPLKTSFISEVNKGKNPLNLFLLIMNKDGDIRKGNIVLYISKDGEKTDKLPENTFYKFYNAQKLDCDGTFAFLNLNDKILYKMGYTNGELSSYGEKTVKTSNGSASTPSLTSSTSSYTDWYLVTTIYYSDGTFDTYIEFLYSTFNGGGGGGGYEGGGVGTGNGDGGSGQNGDDGEVLCLPKQLQWIVAVNAYGYWHVSSTEQLNGVKKPSLPGGGYFSNITHLSENVVNNAAGGYFWNRSGVTVSYGGASAQSTVSGILKSLSLPDVPIPPTTHNFSFSQVYP